MKKSRLLKISSIIFGLVFILFLAACSEESSQDEGAENTQDTQDKPSVDEIGIGVTFPLSGIAASMGEFVQAAGELAAEEINESGVHGAPLKIYYEDSQMDPKTGVTGLQKLIDVHKVSVVISGGSSVVMAQSPIASESEIILANIAAQSEMLREEGPWVFSFIPTSNLEAEALANLVLEELKLEKVAVIQVDNDYGNDSTDAFIKSFENSGGTIVAREKYAQGATDMRTQLLKIKEAAPDAIIPFSQATEYGHAVKQIKELGIDAQILGTTYALSTENFDIAGDDMNGIVGTATRFDPESSELAKEFYDKFVDKHGQPPIVQAAIMYDTVNILSQVIEEVGYDATAIQARLLEVNDYAGVMGSISIDEDGMSSFPIQAFKIENGQISSY